MRKFNLFGNNLVAASDAFFPFIDGIEKLVQSGVQAVIQPSGSIRDKDIIKFANETDTISKILIQLLEKSHQKYQVLPKKM